MVHPAGNTSFNEALNHPAAVLRQRGNAVTADPYGHVAAAVLAQYEKDNNVTFAALDNDALAYVLAEWSKGVNGDPRADLYGAVNALFGLSQ